MLEANFESLAGELTEHVRATEKAKKKVAFGVQFVKDYIKPKIVAPPSAVLVAPTVETEEKNPWEVPLDLT